MTNDTTHRPKGYGLYNCYLCRRELNAAGVLFNDTLAVIRVFSGVPGQGQGAAGGYAACEAHAAAAIEQAMRPLVRAELHGYKIGDDWQVVAFAVELDAYGDPRMTRRLFVMRKRLFGQDHPQFDHHRTPGLEAPDGDSDNRPRKGSQDSPSSTVGRQRGAETVGGDPFPSGVSYWPTPKGRR